MSWTKPSSFLDILWDDLERETTGSAGGAGWVGGARRTRVRRTERVSAADTDYNQDRPSYTKGERVVHQTFGSGTIVELSGFGPGLKVTVDFAEAGRKKLVVRYAGLEKDYF